ncbi:sulfur carrier protein ThiS [Ewingella americana]|uniref:Sulfur carrier protein ThiS n=1 Tax=Ewingella americana TaxID=41202 RepID=A0A502FUG1_9GAMM|nr:sulfur carrier protein ThiS [Ewingella americana]TPG53198.1 sulfur carrier protein ThiS [Ewingella americana]
MNLIINDVSHLFDQALTLSQLLEKMNLEQPGSALAVNQVIIPRHHWPAHWLKDGDNILLFQAIAGG